MAMLHYQRVGADTVGTTTGTRETIGTITIPSNCTNVYGIIAQRGSSATTTAAEATQGKFYVNPRSIGIQEFNFFGATPGGGACATNIGGFWDTGIYVPFRALGPPANETVTFTYDTITEMTAEDYAQVFLLTSNGGIDETVLKQRGHSLSALQKWCDWSESARDIDIYDSTSEVMAQTISIPASIGLIHAMAVTVSSTDNTTAGEHFAGYITMTGTIPDLNPMDLPMPLQSASLGTPVEVPNNQLTYIFPMYIPHEKVNDTLTLTVNLAATCTAEFVVGVTLFGTKR